MSYEKVPGFKPADKKKPDRIQFVNFGSEGEVFIVHISDWSVYEMPAQQETWRSTLFILDHEGRGIRINSTGFQEELKPFWKKKSSLTIRRWIEKDKKGKFLFSTTIYKVNQFDLASLWSYKELSDS